MVDSQLYPKSSTTKSLKQQKKTQPEENTVFMSKTHSANTANCTQLLKGSDITDGMSE